MPTRECAPLDTAFKQSEQKVSDMLIEYKDKPHNAYWGRIRKAGSFPSNSGTVIKQTIYGRSMINPPRWQGYNDSLCDTNACANPAQEMLHHGFDERTYSLARTSFRTPWICLESLVFRENPELELRKIQDSLKAATRYVWEEFSRSRYIDACQNKVLATVDDSDLTDGCCEVLKKKCTPGNIRNDGFVWARYSKLDGSPGEINENYIFANVNPTKLENVAELSPDIFDSIYSELEMEDDNMQFISQGIDLLDVILGDERCGARLLALENQRLNGGIALGSYGGYDSALLKKTLGTKFVLRDQYSIRYDPYSARFYPDVAYNTALQAQVGYAYDENNPETWPRLVRVYRYRQVKSSIEGGGVLAIPNKENYLRAPFVISTVFSPQVVDQQDHPMASGFGSAQKSERGKRFDWVGSANWINPDWACNEDGNKGFWKVNLGAAMRPNKPENGYAILHRVDHSISLKANCCALPEMQCYAPVTPYCYESAATDDTDSPTTDPSINKVVNINSGLTIN